MKLLKKVVARRFASAGRREVSKPDLDEMAQYIGEGFMPVDEVLEIIVLPDFDERASTTSRQVEPETIVLSPEITTQCRNYVSLIAAMYRDNPFHNFEVRVFAGVFVFLCCFPGDWLSRSRVRNAGYGMPCHAKLFEGHNAILGVVLFLSCESSQACILTCQLSFSLLSACISREHVSIQVIVQDRCPGN